MIKTKYVGNKKIDVEINGFTLHTDLPAAMKGDNSAPNAFDMFLASLASCTATFALLYLEKAGIKKDGISVDLDPVYTKEGVSSAKVIINVPHDFPQKDENGLKIMVEHCKVGKHINFPHEVVIVRK